MIRPPRRYWSVLNPTFEGAQMSMYSLAVSEPPGGGRPGVGAGAALALANAAASQEPKRLAADALRSAPDDPLLARRRWATPLMAQGHTRGRGDRATAPAGCAAQRRCDARNAARPGAGGCGATGRGHRSAAADDGAPGGDFPWRSSNWASNSATAGRLDEALDVLPERGLALAPDATVLADGARPACTSNATTARRRAACSRRRTPRRPLATTLSSRWPE